jgi:NarL family two-component system response regulator LiaR
LTVEPPAGFADSLDHDFRTHPLLGFDAGRSTTMTPGRRLKLTPREEAIGRAILAAKTNKDIAGELGISEQSVKNRLSQVYRKVGVKNRLELMRFLLQESAGRGPAAVSG